MISACGTLIFSTSNRLTRIVDRVRQLSQMMEQLFSGEVADFPDERLTEVNRQLTIYAKRSQLIQHALSGFYVSLAALVGTTVSIALTAIAPFISWLPAVLGVGGTLFLFYSSVLLIAEARIALRSVNAEMEFTLKLSELYRARPRAPAS